MITSWLEKKDALPASAAAGLAAAASSAQVTSDVPREGSPRSGGLDDSTGPPQPLKSPAVKTSGFLTAAWEASFDSSKSSSPASDDAALPPTNPIVRFAKHVHAKESGPMMVALDEIIKGDAATVHEFIRRDCVSLLIELGSNNQMNDAWTCLLRLVEVLSTFKGDQERARQLSMNRLLTPTLVGICMGELESDSSVHYKDSLRVLVLLVRGTSSNVPKLVPHRGTFKALSTRGTGADVRALSLQIYEAIETFEVLQEAQRRLTERLEGNLDV